MVRKFSHHAPAAPRSCCAAKRGFWVFEQRIILNLCSIVRSQSSALQRFICLCEHWGPSLSEVHITSLSLLVMLSSEIWRRIWLLLCQLAQQTSIVSGGTEKDCNSISQGRWSKWRVGDVLPSLGSSSSVRSTGTHRHLPQQLYFTCYLLKPTTHKHILHHSTYLLYNSHQ